MILAISQYIEALWSPDGRFGSLERLHPVCDDAGVPLFVMPGHGLVDFEIAADGKKYTMRCPLRCDPDATRRLHALAEKDRGLDGLYFSEWRVLPSEVVLFGTDGGAFEVDVLVRPKPYGEPLTEFLAGAAARGDFGAVRDVARRVEELLRWAASVGADGVALCRMLVAPDRSVRVSGFSASGETERIREALDAAMRRGHDPDDGDDIRCVRDGGGWMYVDRTGRAVIDAVWVAAEPFRGGRAEVETLAGKGLIDARGQTVLVPRYEELTWDDYWGVAAVMAEGRWSLADRDGTILTSSYYDWLGECSEGMMLAVKEGKCGFIDMAGREPIPFAYDDASSFSEGCALVALSGEEFFIDARGR